MLLRKPASSPSKNFLDGRLHPKKKYHLNMKNTALDIFLCSASTMETYSVTNQNQEFKPTVKSSCFAC